MRYVIEFVDGQTAQQAFELLGKGYLAGAREGRRLFFETLQHAQWAQRELANEGMAGLVIEAEQEPER